MRRPGGRFLSPCIQYVNDGSVLLLERCRVHDTVMNYYDYNHKYDTVRGKFKEMRILKSTRRVIELVHSLITVEVKCLLCPVLSSSFIERASSLSSVLVLNFGYEDC